MTLDKKECEKCVLDKAFCQCGWVGKTDENCHQSSDNSVESWEKKIWRYSLNSEYAEDLVKTIYQLLASSRSQVVEETENKNNILKLIHSLVESDAGFESDCVEVDIANGREVSEREKTLARLVGHIYKIVHPLFSTCQHPNWENETKDLLDKLK